MTTGEVIWSIVIGLLTGGVSGALVSFFFERRAAEKEKQLRIAYEKQELYQYLLHVFDELVIIQNKRDVSRLIWILGAKPFSSTLLNTTEKEISSLLEESEKVLDEISTFCFSRIDDVPFSNFEKDTITEWENAVIKLAGGVEDLV